MTSSRRAGRTAPARRDRTARKPARPFTIDHFRAYAGLLILDSGDPWDVEDFQLDVVDDVFAGTPEVWDLVGEENGKSTLMGGFALYHADYTPQAAVALAAASRDQCGILLGQAAGFVRRTPGMNKRFRLFEKGYRQIRGLRLGSVIQVFSADDRTGDGAIFTLAMVDELHRHRDLRLYRTWSGKTNKRGGQVVVISYAGEPGSEFEQTVRRIRSEGESTPTRDGHERVVSEDVVLHRWAVADDGDPEDLEQVKAANPLSKITIETLRRKRNKPTMTLTHWRRFTCNQAIRDESEGVSAQEWTRALTDDRPAEGAAIYGVGVRLNWTGRPTAIVPLWRPDEDHAVLLKPTLLRPPANGTSLPPSRVQKALKALFDANPFETVAILTASGGEQMAEWIDSTLGCEVVMYAGGNVEKARCARRFLEALRAEPEPTVRHVGDASLTAHVLGAQTRTLANESTVFAPPPPPRSGQPEEPPRIDAFLAALIIHDAAVTPPETTVTPMFAWR